LWLVLLFNIKYCWTFFLHIFSYSLFHWSSFKAWNGVFSDLWDLANNSTGNWFSVFSIKTNETSLSVHMKVILGLQITIVCLHKMIKSNFVFTLCLIKLIWDSFATVRCCKYLYFVFWIYPYSMVKKMDILHKHLLTLSN
jgi:hypothetical protein